MGEGGGGVSLVDLILFSWWVTYTVGVLITHEGEGILAPSSALHRVSREQRLALKYQY